jgi:PAS domain S-box-containing protein
MTESGNSTSAPLADASLIQVASRLVRELRRGPDWHRVSSDVVQALGTSTQSSRCYICRLQPGDAGTSLLSELAEWSADDGWSEVSSETVVPMSPVELEAAPIWPQLVDGTRVDGLTECPEPLLAYLESRKTKSIVCVPVRARDQFWGWLGVDRCDADHDWPSAVPAAVHVVADALGAVIEQELTEIERARLNAMFEHSEDAIIGKLLDGTVVEWNKSAERIYGYSAEEMIGDSVTRLIPEALIDEFHDIMDRLQAGERIEHHQTRRIRKDGTELAISLSVSPILARDNHIVGALSIARDVTREKQAELELRSSESRLKLALEAGNIGAWDWNIITSEVVWSSNMESLHGQDPGTFDGTFDGFRSGVHPDDYERVTNAIQRAISGDAEYELEYRSLRRDGSYQWLATHGSVVRDCDGTPLRMTGVCYDITEKKRNEAAQLQLLAQVQRARSEADAEVLRFREMFKHAPAMIAMVEGPEHVFMLANERYMNAVGNREILHKPILKALPEIENQGLIELLDLVYTQGETVTRSELPVMIDQEGIGQVEERFFSFAYQPFRDRHNEITGVLIHAVDLTDHVRARQRVEQLVRAVASERDRLQQIVDVMPEGVAICDLDGQISLSNKTAREIWGQASPPGGFESYDVLRPLTLDLCPYPIEKLPLARSVREGETVLGEQMVIQNYDSGEMIYVLVNSAPLRDGTGAIIGGVVVFQDIRPLRDFERQKDEFLQAVTHDLKNPLTTIRGHVQLLQRMENLETERVQAAVGNVDTAANRAISLVDEILDLTRLQMGRSLEMASSPVDLVDVAGRIINQHQSTTDKHTLVLDANEPVLMGEWDPLRIERVVANLVSNAINYSPEGGIVTVRVRRDTAVSPASAVLEVEDQGLGIPALERSHLFERFWRGSNVREQVPGTGLGLAGAKAIVEAHGGDITVESEEGQGSTFTVSLPLTQAVRGVDVS